MNKVPDEFTELNNCRYKSGTITMNEDETYEIVHIFENDNGKRVIKRYPSVEMRFETTLEIVQGRDPHIEYWIKERDGVLFTVTIEE